MSIENQLSEVEAISEKDRVKSAKLFQRASVEAVLAIIFTFVPDILNMNATGTDIVPLFWENIGDILGTATGIDAIYQKGRSDALHKVTLEIYRIIHPH